MNCDLPEAKLWSWIDREAPELEDHLAVCPVCRDRACRIREDIRLISADLTQDVPLPEKVGNYRVKRLLGEGGQALVYAAEQESPRRDIALKVLRGGRFAGEKHVKHFLRETRTLARLNHPAIATIFESGRTDDGLHYFAMELVDGRPLTRYAKEEDLGRNARLELFIRICRAVNYAHEKGVVHRDLKPSNILVTGEGAPKILDFGLAHMTRAETDIAVSLTRTGMMAGTPRYMSPEQIRGNSSDIGPATDVYSLGVILYELLTGQPPYEAASFTPESVMSICEEEPVRPSRLDASVRGDLETIVLKALAKDPAARYGTPDELADDLKRYLEGRVILARRPVWWRGFGKALARYRAAVIATVLVLAVGGYLAWSLTRPPYDVDTARLTILGTRAQYFLEGPTNLVIRHRALGAPEQYPGLTDAVLLKAVALASEREGGLAILYLTGELAKDPDQWLYNALMVSVGVERDTALDESFERWMASRTEESEADCWYLRTFTTLDPYEAYGYTVEALRADPGHPLALEMNARLAAVTGHLDGGVAATTHLLEAGDRRREFWLMHRSILLCRLGLPHAAMADIDQLVAEDPGQSRHYLARAQILRWMGQYEKAVDDCTVAIKLVDENRVPTGWLYYHRGTPLLLCGRLGEAVEDYRRSYRLLARVTFGNARLVLALRDLGRVNEADAELKEARSRISGDPWLGRILACLAGDITPSELLALADETSPQQLCEGHYYAGEVFRQAGRFDAAKAMYEQSVATGQLLDQSNYKDRLSEYDLARLRLGEMVAD